MEVKVCCGNVLARSLVWAVGVRRVCECAVMLMMVLRVVSGERVFVLNFAGGLMGDK